MKQNLNQTQLSAVTYGEGPLLVTAGPGSGKTTVITHRILHLIANPGVLPNEILVITFTKSAAEEMKERFLRLTNEKDTQVVFGTFHAFFYQILRQSGLYEHDSIIKEKEKYSLLRDILKTFQIKFHENTFLDEILSEISLIKNKQTKENHTSNVLEDDIFHAVYAEYLRRMKIMNKIDFDDMVTKCYELLLKDGNVLRKWQERFRYILVDEFQDINDLQYQILKLLAQNHHNIFAVGDEDQSIYSFRGANPQISFQFLKDYPETKQIFLSINYRSDISIVKASLNLIRHNKNRFIKHIDSFQKEGGHFHVLQYDCEKEEYEALAKQLSEYNKAGKIQQCAILFRTNMINPVFLKELRKYHIPYHIPHTIKSWSEHPVVKDILAYLSLSKGNMCKKDLMRVMNKPSRYISADMTGDTEEVSWDIIRENARQKTDVRNHIQKMQQDIYFMKELPLVAALSYIRRGIGYEKWLKSQESNVYREGEEILEWLRELAYECETLEELKVALEEEYESESDREDKVPILTYHGAKGLEWPTVFLPDVIDGITPYRKAKKKEEIEEERRMFYVALTRAKEDVYIYSLHPDEKHKKSPSIFLKEMKGEK